MALVASRKKLFLSLPQTVVEDSNPEPGEFTPELKFNDARNSQYIGQVV